MIHNQIGVSFDINKICCCGEILIDRMELSNKVVVFSFFDYHCDNIAWVYVFYTRNKENNIRIARVEQRLELN